MSICEEKAPTPKSSNLASKAIFATPSFDFRGKMVTFSLMNSLCLHVPDCGGCTSQQIPYPEQLRHKQAEIEKIFTPFNVPVAPIIPCKDPWRYRNKMEFSFSQNKAGDRYLGLILRKSRGKVFNLQECLISPSWMSEALQRVRSWWESTPLSAFNFRNGQGTLRTLTLREGRRTKGRMAMLTVSGDPRFALTRTQLEGFVKAMNDPYSKPSLGGRRNFMRCILEVPIISLNSSISKVGRSHLK